MFSDHWATPLDLCHVKRQMPSRKLRGFFLLPPLWPFRCCVTRGSTMPCSSAVIHQSARLCWESASWDSPTISLSSIHLHCYFVCQKVLKQIASQKRSLPRTVYDCHRSYSSYAYSLSWYIFRVSRIAPDDHDFMLHILKIFDCCPENLLNWWSKISFMTLRLFHSLTTS